MCCTAPEALLGAAEGGGQRPLILGVIIGCEIGFWVVLAVGLLARYALRKPTLSTVLLVCVPLVDLVLVTVSIVDLRTGGTAATTHSLAAAYLGVSVAFGPEMVRRADARFAHRYGEGPKPEPPPKHGAAKVRHEWTMWTRCLVALLLSCALALLMFLLAAPGSDPLALWNFQVQLAIVTAVWFVGWPLRYTLFPPRESAD